MENIKTFIGDSGNKLKISYSEGDTRSWENLTKIICFHNRYSLGDKHDYDVNDYNGWNEMEKAIIKNENVAIIKPLYMYDHSGITISTSPFNCRWDSGQIGFVIITKDAIRKSFGIKKVTKKYLEISEKVLNSEVEIYDQEVKGEVYGFEITDSNDVHIDSCGGFYGNDFENNGMLDYVDEEFHQLLIENS